MTDERAFQTEQVADNKVAAKRIALGVSGGIAAYKAVEVLRGLQRAGCLVRVAMTEHATRFVTPLTFRALTGEHVVTDDYAPDNPDPIAHITFSQTIDLLVIAPATANIIAKMANGVADDFLTSTYLAAGAPVLVAPAMNTRMWLHPATQRNVAQLRADGVHFVEPDAGEMACGTVGAGRLSEPEMIVRRCLELLGRADDARLTKSVLTTNDFSGGDLSGERVLITVGATREAIDPVRFISNRSSGKMGFALAEVAAARDADVTIVAGATSVSAPLARNIRTVCAASAEDMREAVQREIVNQTIFIAAAAVSDYRPQQIAAHKIKKSDDVLTIRLEPTIDILAEVSARRAEYDPRLLVIGFAAETNDALTHAREKMRRKQLDAIVLNDVSATDAGFETDTNRVQIITGDALTGDASVVDVPLLSKREVAARILDTIAELRQKASKVMSETPHKDQKTETHTETANV